MKGACIRNRPGHGLRQVLLHDQWVTPLLAQIGDRGVLEQVHGRIARAEGERQLRLALVAGERGPRPRLTSTK
ncbi:MAG: hypothetical protein ACRDNE_07710 [Gaiellaceae bacterium]